MATQIIESDDFAFGAEAADTSAIHDYDEIAWDTDPAAILEAREQDEGVNCYGQPIN